jgi:DNA primase
MTLEDLVREVFPHLIERDNGEVYVDCPFCEEKGETRDTRSRLGIDYENGTWNCFNCNYRGRDNPEWLFRELVRVFDLDRAEYIFSWRSQLERQQVPKKKEHLSPVSLPKEFEPLWEKSSDSIHKQALKYVLERGVTKKQIENHFIGFCAVGTYARRIVFPVYRKEQVIGFVARSFDVREKQRYLNSEGLKYIWNAPDDKEKRGLLIEGIFDALAGERTLRRVRVMAGLGHDLTEDQLKPLLKFRELTLVPDPDRVGILGTAKRGKQILELKKIKVFVCMPKEGTYDDWGKWGETERGQRKILRAYKERVEWSKYIHARLRMSATYW